MEESLSATDTKPLSGARIVINSLQVHFDVRGLFSCMDHGILGPCAHRGRQSQELVLAGLPCLNLVIASTDPFCNVILVIMASPDR